MTALLMLVPMSLILLLLAVWLFRWAVRKGQFENLDAAAIDILRDDGADRLHRGEPPEPDAIGAPAPGDPRAGDAMHGGGAVEAAPASGRDADRHAD